MAEKKYELLVHPRRDSAKKIQHQPWYKERLATKYNKPALMKDRTSTLDASAWTFVKDGMDDFRDGLPPLMDSSIVLKGKKGIKPNMRGTNSFNNEQTLKQRIKPKLTKDEAIYSKSVPSHKKRIEKVDELENNLLSHPLALYPHIEESLAPDTFDELVTLLDPALVITDEFEEDEEIDFASSPARGLGGASRVQVHDDDGTESIASSVGFREVFKDAKYKWLYQTQEEINKEERNKANKKRLEAQKADNKIDQVTKEFCDWVRDLGGDSNNIEESTVNSLFASGYDTKPTLSVPVRVVELTNVPPELRADGPSPSPDKDKQEKNGSQSASYTPSWVKVKYGAWYLKPSTWKVLPAEQPLPDPKELEGKQMTEPKKKSKELDKVLTNMHGAKAFKSFMEEKGTRKPDFLESVSAPDEQELMERTTNENLRKRLKRKSFGESPTVTVS